MTPAPRRRREPSTPGRRWDTSRTGGSAPRGNWLADTAVPACLVVGEATWVSLLVSASYNGSTGPHVRLPYLGFAVPAVLAVTATAATARLRWRWGWPALLVA